MKKILNYNTRQTVKRGANGAITHERKGKYLVPLQRIVFGCDEGGAFTIRKGFLMLLFVLFSIGAQAGQCTATTKDGARCKGTPQKGTTFCVFHNPANKCAGVNAKGLPCGAMKAKGSKFCRFHQSQAK